MTKEQLFQRIASILVETFDTPIERIRPDARLGEDLDIDSIDAVDLIVQLKPLLGGNLKPDAFRTVRTVQDVVDALHTMMHAGAKTATGS